MGLAPLKTHETGPSLTSSEHAVSVTSSVASVAEEARQPSAGERSTSSNMSQVRSDVEVFIFKTLRTLGLTFLVYVVGWFGFHWVWVLGGVLMYVIKKKPHNERREDKKKVFGAMCQDEASLLLKYEDLPSWVCFPDTQRAEWLNRCLSQMWPFISDMVSGILKASVEPEIKKHMPSILKSFHFIEVDLGSQPLRIGGIRVYTEHVKPNEILLDAEIIYTGDAVVQVGFSTGTMGIKDLEVRGTIRVELRPILPKSPLVGAVTVYFLESPEIDFDFTNLLNFFDITGVDYLIKVAISKVIDSCLVLPQRITIPIAGPESLVSLQYPMPLGVLTTKILSATGLKAMDHKLFQKDSSDPFVKAKVCRKTHETKVVENSLSPTWNDESFMTFIDRVIGTSITFDVMDYDKNGKHDLIGRAQKNLEELYHGGDKKNNFILQIADGGGSLSCELEWFNFIDDASYIRKHISDDTPTVTCLFVKLEYASGLPAIKMEDGTCSPHVEITLGDTTIQSKTKRNTKKPIWNEIHYFFVHNPNEESILFKVKDESDESLGHFKFQISKLIEMENELKISDLFALQNCFTEGHIRLTLELKGLVSGLCDDGTTSDR